MATKKPMMDTPAPAADKSEKLLNTLNALKDLRDNPITIQTEDSDRSNDK